MTQHFCLRSDLMCESHRKKESAFLSDNPWWCHGFPASVCQVLPLECTQLCDVFITGCDKTSVHLCSQVLLCISHLNSCRVNTAFCSNRPVKCNLTLWQPCSSRTSIVTALQRKVSFTGSWFYICLFSILCNSTRFLEYALFTVKCIWQGVLSYMEKQTHQHFYYFPWQHSFSFFNTAGAWLLSR